MRNTWRVGLAALAALSSLGLFGCLPSSRPELAIATTPHPPVGEYPFTVEFRAIHAGGTGVEYLWDFGDGLTGTGPIVTHTYGRKGTFPVYLTAVGPGGPLQAHTEVQVQSKAPLAWFTVTPAMGAVVRSPVTFDGSPSSDPDGTVVDYVWDFGDGTGASSSNPTLTHTYERAGSYTVTLVVRDADGDASRPATREVVILGSCCGGR